MNCVLPFFLTISKPFPKHQESVKKTAQKLILELKDKLKLEDAFEKKLAHEQEAASVSGFLIHDGRQEAAEALIALGYSSTDAMKAVRKVTDVSPDDVEALLKAALKQL